MSLRQGAKAVCAVPIPECVPPSETAPCRVVAPIPGTSESGTCVDHIEKSFLPIVHCLRSHFGFFSGYVGSDFARTAGLVMEIITHADKVWQ